MTEQLANMATLASQCVWSAVAKGGSVHPGKLQSLYFNCDQDAGRAVLRETGFEICSVMDVSSTLGVPLLYCLSPKDMFIMSNPSTDP